MSVLKLLTFSELARLREIIHILMKYGLGDIVSYLKLDPLKALGQRLFMQKASVTDPRPVRFRKALEELGPTFSKLGQILSARPDLLPPDYIAELSRLQDRVTPLPFEKMVSILEEEWGGPVGQKLLFLDPIPLGQATIAQVHRGQLPDGTEVVVKVQRPGIVPMIESDLALLSVLADLLDDNMEKMRRYRPKEVVREFSRTLMQELDFSHEARNIDRAAYHFKGDPEIVIPRHFPEYSTKRILVLEFLDGIKIDQVDRYPEMGTTPEVIARVGSRAILKQVFVFGFFQGDPHPGNILVLPDSRIGILDYGMFGTLSKHWRTLLGDLLTALIENDTDRVISVLRHMGAIP